MRAGNARSVLALGFWLWTVGIAGGAGFLGTALNCESGEGCKAGSQSWLEPWTWGDHYVYPEAAVTALVALVPASAFVAFVVFSRWWAALGSFAASLALISYAFFGGLTPAGRATFSFGPFFGVAALGILRSSHFRDRRGRPS